MAQPPASRLVHWLSFLAILVLPIVPIGYLLARHSLEVEGLFLPGSLAAAHQGFTCKECHVEPWRGWHKVSGGDRQSAAIMDGVCAQCHGGLLDASVSPSPVDLRPGLIVRPEIVAPHHPRQIPADVGNCTDCHQDHQGEKGLLQVTDESCRRCHSNLRTVDGRHTFYPQLTAFDADHHPPFGWWRKDGVQDPGALRFNHQIHLDLDGHRLHGIDEPRSRLKRQACGFCHQPDSRGRGMAPVRYDQHCAQCHPLTVQIAAETQDGRVQHAVQAFCQEPAPHGTPAMVLAVLRERLRLLAEQNPTIGSNEETTEPTRRIPGRQPMPPAPRTPSGWVDHQAAVLGRLLFDAPGGCRYCHLEKQAARPAASLPEYKRTHLPASWFPFAKFSHARHGLMPCSDCHDKARTSTRTSDVLMPSLPKCLECHRNQPGPGIHARADCLECHQYHAPDLP